MRFLRLWLVMIGSFWNLVAFSQDIHTLKLLPLDQSPEFLQKQVTYQTSFSDSTQIKTELIRVLKQLQSASFLEASVDTLIQTDRTQVALLHLGPSYEWLNLRNGNIEEAILRQSGFRDRLFDRRPLQFSKIRELQESVVRIAEEQGYPFASVWLDSIRLESGQLSARLFWDKGPFYIYGPVEVNGSATISTNYLQQYLGFEPGQAYDRSAVLAARERLRTLPFLEMERNPAVRFLGGEAQVNLFLKEKKASRFDFLIGVLPNSGTTGRMLITGNFKGEFYNQLRRGERIYAAFEQLRPETQRLDLEFNYPYLLGLPFGIDLDFNLYKRDTTFLDLNYHFGVQYLLPGGSYLKAFWNNQSSRLLSINESRIAQTQQLPSELDLNLNQFGLEFRWQKLDYRLNPRRGWDVMLRGSAGTKKILPNSKVIDLELEGLYDTLALRSGQYELAFEIARFWPLFARSTIRSGVRGGYKISDNTIYRNEQYRLGGAQLLRGFDEEFFFATQFTIASLEYRLLIGQNAYFFLFGDYGFLKDSMVEQAQQTQPYGFGGGITFETSVGLFGLSVAVGGQENTPVDLGAPKVHFGYLSLF